MSTPDPRRPESAGVSVVLALVFAVIGFFALAVFGLGAVSLVTDAEIIAVPGLGPLPGVLGMLAAMLGFVAALARALQRVRPRFASVPVIALVAALVHLAVVWLCVLIATGGVVTATVVAGDLVTGGASAVVLVAAAVAGWGGIALRRTRAQHPRWRWERDDDE
ncbi:hypothetical protein ACI3KS_13205 [Microbacterium sp. ZW T5_45]|uniref:hypothetical protein n=1 Tax=Microbacterium sp. ZW T5_45 TaxID=3378080 RepID=UPI00385239A6